MLTSFLPAVASYNEGLARTRKATLLQRSCKLVVSVFFRFTTFNHVHYAWMLVYHQESQHKHVNSGHLELICTKLLDLLHNQETPGLHSLWGTCTTSCISNEKPAELERSMHDTIKVREIFFTIFYSWCRVLFRLCSACFSEIHGTTAKLSTSATNQLV